jgi:predicted ATPase
MESLPTARILLLVNYRPEYRLAWGGKTYYLQVRIDPLPPESADTLLTALLGEDGTLAPLKRVLIARTEGNPFFLEESVRALVETQVLVGERGAYRVTKAPNAWQIPATAQAILGARIDRLPPGDKRLLQAAAVIGKDVPFALLQAIADVPENALRRGLSHLQAAEFLYETSLFPDLEYTFKHAFTHEVAYASVSTTDDARSTRGWSKPSRNALPNGWRSRSSGWPTTQSGARSGRRQSPTCGRRGSRRSPARPTASR